MSAARSYGCPHSSLTHGGAARSKLCEHDVEDFGVSLLLLRRRVFTSPHFLYLWLRSLQEDVGLGQSIGLFVSVSFVPIGSFPMETLKVAESNGGVVLMV